MTTAAGSCELSVVIPARNAADTIGVQLESLARQRFDRPWEVVVVDNGSTDDTRAVAQSFADRLPSLRIVDASERQSIGYARNRGVEAARGRLIAYCDADDAVSEGWLEAIAAGPRPLRRRRDAADHDLLNEDWVRDSRDPPTPSGYHENWYPPYLPTRGRAAWASAASSTRRSAASTSRSARARTTTTASGSSSRASSSAPSREPSTTTASRTRSGRSSGRPTGTRRTTRGSSGSTAPGSAAEAVDVGDQVLAGAARRPPRVVTKRGRARMAWMLGWELGRLRGSLKYRVLAV